MNIILAYVQRFSYLYNIQMLIECFLQHTFQIAYFVTYGGNTHIRTYARMHIIPA